MSGPEIAVVVPSYRRPEALGRLLGALERQTLPRGRWEALVGYDAADAATAAAIEGHPLAAAGALRAIPFDPDPGPAAKRNAGARAARAPLIAFTDDDCVPEPGWLEAALAALAEHDIAQGPVRPLADGPIGPYDRVPAVAGATPLFEAANLLVRREAFERAGGFEPLFVRGPGKPFGEDALFGWRALRAGARRGFCAEAAVRHEVERRDPAGYIGERRRLGLFASLAREVPELRRELMFARAFLTPRSAAFDAALAGAALALLARSPLPLLAAAPYCALLAGSARTFRARVAAVELAADAVGLASLVRGSLRARTLVL